MKTKEMSVKSFICRQSVIIILQAVIIGVGRFLESILTTHASLTETARLKGEVTLAYTELMMKLPKSVYWVTVVLVLTLLAKLGYNTFVFVKQYLNKKEETK